MARLAGSLFLAIVLVFSWCAGCSSHRGTSSSSFAPEPSKTKESNKKSNHERLVQENPPKIILKNSNKGVKSILLRLNLQKGHTWLGNISGDLSVSFDPRYLPPSAPSSSEGHLSASVEGRVIEAEKDRIKISSRSGEIVVTNKGEEASKGVYPAQESVVVVDTRARLLARELGLFRWLHYLPYLPFPEQPVAPEASWVVESTHSGTIFVDESQALSANFSLQETYVLKGKRVHKGIKVWEIRGEAISSDKSFRAKGIYYIDEKTGLVVFAQVKQEAKMEIPDHQRGHVPVIFTGNITAQAEIHGPRSGGP